MKKILACFLALLSLLAFNGCDNKTENENSNPEKEPFDIDAQTSAIIENYQIEGGELYYSTSDDELDRLDDEIIRNLYGDIASVPDFSTVEQYSVFIGGTPLAPCEFGIFKMKDSADTEQFMLYLKDRIDSKIENARHYPEIDAEALTTSKLETENGYVWYLIVKGGNEDINNEIKEKV